MRKDGCFMSISSPQNPSFNRREAEKGLRGLESRARCAGFSVMEIGNRKERLRVREAGASAAGRGQRPYASFPDESPQAGFGAAAPT